MALKVPLLSLAQTSLLLTLAAGCSSSTLLTRNQGIQTTPYLGANPPPPGPLKQLASKVSNSSFGQSVSKAFHAASARKGHSRVRSAWLGEKVEPADADFYVQAGNVCATDNDPESARVNYHKALEMQPHHLNALLGLARLFDRQGQLERASEHYLEATKYHPGEAVAYNDLGLCYARQGKYDDAVKALSRAVELQPDRALYRNNIATVLVVQGRIDEALAHLTDAHGAAVAHYNVGFLLNKRGHPRQALEQFSLALQADPSMSAAQEWVESLSSQLAPESRQEFQIASGVRPGAAGEQDADGGPQIDASMAPPSDDGAAFASDGQLGSPAPEAEPAARQGEVEPADVYAAQPADILPSAVVERRVEQSAADAIPEAAEEPAEKEPELQYLPPVTSRKTSPSRY